MTKFNFKLKFWLIVALQILILFSLLAYNQYRLIVGEKILLKLTPPPDPLALFQGHYLALNYEISELNANEYIGPSNLEPGETVYVLLYKKGGYYRAFGVSREKPKEGIFIKGKVISNYRGDLEIRYGIENYFIPEKKANEIEREFRKLIREKSENLFVQVSLDREGNALITKLLAGRKEIDLES